MTSPARSFIKVVANKTIAIILASFVYELLDIGAAPALDIWPTVAAFIAALASGILAIKFMLALIRRVKLHWFSVYLAALSVICLFIF